MAISHDEVIEFLCEEIESLARMCLGHVRNSKPLDDPDDVERDLIALLDRWGDRLVPKDPLWKN